MSDGALGRPPRHERPTKANTEMRRASLLSRGDGPEVTIEGSTACEGGCGRDLPTSFTGPGDSFGAKMARARLEEAWCEECADRRDEAERAAEREAERVEQEEKRLKRSGLPARWHGLKLESIERDAPRADAFDAIERWVKGETRGVLLHGEVGRGKTVLAAAAARARLRRSHVRWLSVANLLLQLRMPFDSPEYAAAARSLDSGTGVGLVLDDLDKLKPTEHAMQPLYVAVNGWVEANAPLLVTLNRTVDDLAAWGGETFGDAIASRLAGHCEIVRVGGRDRRTS